MKRLMMSLGGAIRRVLCYARGGHGPRWEEYRPWPDIQITVDPDCPPDTVWVFNPERFRNIEDPPPPSEWPYP